MFDDDDEAGAPLEPKGSLNADSWIEALTECETLGQLEAFGEERFSPPTPRLRDLLHLRNLFIKAYRMACDPSREDWERIRLGHLALDPCADDDVARQVEAANQELEQSRPTEDVKQETAPVPRAPIEPRGPEPGAAPAGSAWAAGLRRAGAYAPPPAPEVAVEGPDSSSLSVDETAGFDILTLNARVQDATPFERGSMPSPLHPPGLTEEELRDLPDVGATATAGIATIKPVVKLPMSLDNYAALVVRMESDESPASVRGAFGLASVEAEQGLREQMSAALENDPRLMKLYQEALARCRQWMEESSS